MPAETSEAVTARVGKREFSAYVARATARQLERDALADLIAHIEAESGPVDEVDVQEIMDRLAQS
jgi:hypothetical protein